MGGKRGNLWGYGKDVMKCGFVGKRAKKKNPGECAKKKFSKLPKNPTFPQQTAVGGGAHRQKLTQIWGGAGPTKRKKKKKHNSKTGQRKSFRKG